MITMADNLQSPWTEEQKREMIERFNAKESMGTIAEHFGTTRAAVAGIIHRLRKKNNTDISIRPIDPVRVKPLVHRWGERVLKPKPEPKPKMVTLMQLPVATEHKRPRLRLVQDQEVCLLDLKNHHCRFPLGDPRHSDFRFCGQNRIDTGPYCQEHADLAYRVPEVRLRRR